MGFLWALASSNSIPYPYPSVSHTEETTGTFWAVGDQSSNGNIEFCAGNKRV
jgi:hypothetical protein